MDLDELIDQLIKEVKGSRKPSKDPVTFVVKAMEEMAQKHPEFGPVLAAAASGFIVADSIKRTGDPNVFEMCSCPSCDHNLEQFRQVMAHITEMAAEYYEHQMNGETEH